MLECTSGKPKWASAIGLVAPVPLDSDRDSFG
jgi:hypothetical protein